MCASICVCACHLMGWSGKKTEGQKAEEMHKTKRHSSWMPAACQYLRITVKILFNWIFTTVYQCGVLLPCFSVAHSNIPRIMQFSPIIPLEIGRNEVFCGIMFCFLLVVSTFIGLLKHCPNTSLKLHKKRTEWMRTVKKKKSHKLAESDNHRD